MFSVVTVLLAVSGFLSGPVLAQNDIKIGVYLPMTGGVAAYGKMEWSGIQTANSMAPEVLGKKIALTYWIQGASKSNRPTRSRCLPK